MSDKKDVLDLNDLVNEIASEENIAAAVVKKALDAYHRKLAQGLVDKGFVEAHNLGTLSLKTAAARVGEIRGKQFDKPEGLRIKFKPAAGLKKVIADATQKRVI